MAISERHKQYLDLMGIQSWELRHGQPPAVETVAAVLEETTTDSQALVSDHEVDDGLPVTSSAKPDYASMDWDQLRNTVLACER